MPNILQTHILKVFSVAILCLIALSEIWLCFGPPWLDHKANVILPLVISLPVYGLVIAYYLQISTRLRSTHIWVASFLLLIMASIYLWLFLGYTHEAPDHCHREVVGYDLLPDAQKYMTKPGMSIARMLADNGNQADGLFTDRSLLVVRYGLTISWVLIFCCLAILLAAFTVGSQLGGETFASLTDEQKNKLADLLSPPQMASENDVTTEKANKITVVNTLPKATFNIVFIHGVDGHWRNTWTANSDQHDGWLEWIASSFPEAAVWSVHYNVSTLHWKGGTMSLRHRARSVINMLDAENVFKLPTFFIVHSFGGLLTKQLWRDAADQSRADILQSIKGVVFLATPHLGARLADYAHLVFVRFLLQPTVTVSDLTKDAPELIALGEWYRNHPIDRNFVYFETQPLLGRVLVVDEVSSDPAIKGVYPVPVFANHVSICKPSIRGAPLVKNVIKAIEDTMGVRAVEV